MCQRICSNCCLWKISGMTTSYGRTPCGNLDPMETSQEELVSSVQEGQLALVAYN